MSDVDLLVAGAGGGLVGALRAAQLGMSVAVIDANEHYPRGNNTAMSTAMIPGAGSRFQRAAGIDDSAEHFLSDIRKKTCGQAAEPVARALAERSAELVEWLADHLDMPIELPTDFNYPGHSAQRVHTIPDRHGATLLRHLNSAARRDENIDLLAPCKLIDIRAEQPDGARTATVTTPDGGREEITANAVLLATNGHGADSELVAHHQPEIATATYHGSEHSVGDALRIGTGLGAATGYLDSYQGHAALSATTRTLVTWTTVMHGAIVVNTDGQRFGDESTGYSEYAAALATQPDATGWLVFDATIHELSLPFTDYREVATSGAVRTADSATELAESIGVATDALAAELAEATGVANGERRSDRYGRARFERALTPPYKAVRIVPALFHTQGGLLIDGHARVLDQQGTPLSNLYAAGGAAAGISGHGAAGYLAGNGLLPALGLSYLAADHVARGRASRSTESDHRNTPEQPSTSER